MQGAHIFQNTLFRGVQTFIIILMTGDFKATPFARLFFCIFLKGCSKEIDHLSLVVFFLHSRTFQARFGVWSLLLPARRVLRASERVWERVQIGKLFHRWKHISKLWVTLFRGVKTFIFISMCRVHKYFRILYLGESKHSFFILMSRVNKYFRTLYLGECKHSFLFWCVGCTHISEHFI